MSDSARRKIGRDYSNQIFRIAGKDATLNDLRWTVNKVGSVQFYLNSEILNEKMGLPSFSYDTDEDIAENAKFTSEEISLMNINLQYRLFDLCHSITHIATDSRQNPNDEMRIIGGYHGLFNMSAEHFVCVYLHGLLLKNEESKNLKLPTLPEFVYDTQEIENALIDRQKRYGNKDYFKIDIKADVPPIKIHVADNELAITPESHLEATVRSRFARHKIISASEYGEQIFIKYQPELRNVPAKVIYTENAERELAWKIAQDKPVNIHDPRIPLTVIQIKESKEFIARERERIEKIYK